MCQLRLAVLGTPEVFLNGSRLTFALRKAQALLLYLAVEGGMHPRSKLAAFLWPDSETCDARAALRNAIALLRTLLAPCSPDEPLHLVTERDLLGLDRQFHFELDLDIVEHAYHQALRLTSVPSEPQSASLIDHIQQALSLVRGPFLDGFWLGEESPFDEWVQQQQQQWQVRQQVLFNRLSSLQEEAGELERARLTLSLWLTYDPLSEEAARRLMRVNLASGDPTAAWQVYTSLRARLADELQVNPSADTIALAELVRNSKMQSQGSLSPHPASTTAASQHTYQFAAPLIGRSNAFHQLVSRFKQAQQGQPQVVLIVGEAGIGKTRLTKEFVAWPRAQGAEVLCGQSFEAGGRLPYQVLVDALQPRLEKENAPEDLLDDLWLAELARLLPELRVRYPDLPAPTEDALAAKVRLFEAVARLLNALSQRAPLLLLIDDLQWADADSLDLLRYLARSWSRHGSRVLLVGTVRSEELESKTQLAAVLADLERDVPVTHVPLQPLSHAETLQFLESLISEGSCGKSREQKMHEPILSRDASTGKGTPTMKVGQNPIAALADFLFAHTGGHPLYLLETFKILRERGLLAPRLGNDGAWRLELHVQLASIIAQEKSQIELLPPSLQTMIQAHLTDLTHPARRLSKASSVLGTLATAECLWQVAEVEMHEGVEALEEAVSNGILREESTGAGRPSRYHFAHDLIRAVVTTPLGEARWYALQKRAQALLETERAWNEDLVMYASAS